MKKIKTLICLSAVGSVLWGAGIFHGVFSASKPWNPHPLWTSTEELTYRISFSAAGAIDLSAIFRNKPDGMKTTQQYSSAWEGSIAIQSLGHEGEEHRLLLRTLDLGALRIAGSTEEELSILAQSLQSGIEIRVAPGGRILSFSARNPVSALGVGLLQAVLSPLQLSLPDPGPRSSWQNLEIDGTGTYQARYQVLTSVWDDWIQGSTTLGRTKAAYTTLAAAAEGSAERLHLRALPEGGTKIVLSGECRCVLERIDSQESIDLMASRNRRLGNSSVLLRLEKIEVPRDGSWAANGKEISRPFRYSIDGAERREEARLQLQRKILGNTSWEDLSRGLEAMQARTSNPGLPEAELDIHLKLKAYVALHPEAAGALLGKLRGLSPDDPRYLLIVGAFSASGGESGQEALRSLLLERSESLEDTRLLIPLLSQVTAPTVATEELLVRLSHEDSAPETRSSAQLALGSLARNLQSSDPRRAEALVGSLAGELAKNQDPTRKAELIAALGNSGDPTTLEVLAPVLHAAESPVTVRTEAVYALRNLEDPASEKILLEVLESNPDTVAPDEMREQAVKALSYRTATPRMIEAQQARLAGEPSPAIRLGLLANLAHALEDDPNRLRNVLETAASADASEEVRTEAERLLKESQS